MARPVTFDPVAWDDEVDWSGLLTALGGASDVPRALRDLASATDDEQAQQLYWQLDNVVVVQGSAYEAAPFTVGPLMRIALSGSSAGRRWALELLLQLAAGWGDPAEVERVGFDPADASRERLRAWIEALYTIVIDDVDDQRRELALEIAAAVDDEDERLRRRLHWLVAHRTESRIREAAAEILARGR